MLMSIFRLWLHILPIILLLMLAFTIGFAWEFKTIISTKNGTFLIKKD